MKFISISLLATFIFFGCSTSRKKTDNNKETLNAVVVVTDPLPGEHEMPLTVTFSKPTNSGDMEFKEIDENGLEKWVTLDENSCGTADPFENPNKACISLTETKTITYRLSNLLGNSDSRSLTFTKAGSN
jgi:hypothetical protein